MAVDHSIKQYIDESLPALLDKSGKSWNYMWSGKWLPCASRQVNHLSI